MDFKPCLRFAVMSDLHYSTKHPYLRKRFQSAMETIYDYSKNNPYPRLDALYVIGDFANNGTREQMEMFHQDCMQYLKPETKLVVTLANHELHYVPDYLESFKNFEEIFQMALDRHEVIGGYHLISLSTTIDKGPWHDSFDAPKQTFLKEALKEARSDTGNRPIFVLQHPGIFGTIRGGVYGNAELYPILSEYPQVIDFSGHSHFPVNDPREICQKHFTAVSTGSLFNINARSTLVTPHVRENAIDPYALAHMLVVEADDSGAVRIRKLDVIAGEFFENDIWLHNAHLPENHQYTERRAAEASLPYFPEGSKLTADYKENTLTLTVPRAACEGERVYEYHACVYDSAGTVISQKSLVSDFPALHQQDSYTLAFPELLGASSASVYAIGFWDNRSRPLTVNL